MENNNKIEIFGKSNLEGVGMVIRGLDSNSNSNIDIRNVTFKNDNFIFRGVKKLAQDIYKSVTNSPPYLYTLLLFYHYLWILKSDSPKLFLRSV